MARGRSRLYNTKPSPLATDPSSLHLVDNSNLVGHPRTSHDSKTPETLQQWVEEELASKKSKSFIITDRELEILDHGFASVKAEFSDLDGMKWKADDIRLRTPQKKCHFRAKTDTSPFVVLTNEELASFRVDETIRARSPSKPKPSIKFPVITDRPRGIDISQYAERDDEDINEDFVEIADSDFDTPSDPTPAPVLRLQLHLPLSATRKSRRKYSTHSIDLSAQRQAEMEELILLGRPTTPNPDSPPQAAADDIENDHDIFNPSKRRLRKKLPVYDQ